MDKRSQMKFAYLIIAHDSFNQLLILLKLLDDADNDIFLHIDRKVEEFDDDLIKKSIKNANLRIYHKFDVKWAGISLTKCQMYLFKQATKTEHDFYHLLSGFDLPLKSNAKIKAFFEENKGKEFIHFVSNDFWLDDSCRYYHFGHNRLAVLLLAIQRKLGVNRKLYYGAQWCSITHNLACELVANERKMLRMVSWTSGSDEKILQTFYRKVAKGKYELYKNTAGDYSAVARLVDWNRGTGSHPYVWHKEDYTELINSDRMFARKFDEKVDSEIIKMLVDYIREQSAR